MRARKLRLVDPLAQRLVRVACQRRLTLETHPQVNRGGNAAEQRGAAAATRRGRGSVGRLSLVDSMFRRQTAVPGRLSEVSCTDDAHLQHLDADLVAVHDRLARVRSLHA